MIKDNEIICDFINRSEEFRSKVGNQISAERKQKTLYNLFLEILMQNNIVAGYDLFLTVNEVANLFKINRNTVIRSLIKNGKLQAVKMGKQYRIPTSGVISYIEKNFS